VSLHPEAGFVFSNGCRSKLIQQSKEAGKEKQASSFHVIPEEPKSLPVDTPHPAHHSAATPSCSSDRKPIINRTPFYPLEVERGYFFR